MNGTYITNRNIRIDSDRLFLEGCEFTATGSREEQSEQVYERLQKVMKGSNLDTVAGILIPMEGDIKGLVKYDKHANIFIRLSSQNTEREITKMLSMFRSIGAANDVIFMENKPGNWMVV